MVDSSWTEAISKFGSDTAMKLAGPGDREAAIRAPLDQLLKAAGDILGLVVIPFDEVRDSERGVRPDYAVAVGGLITGYLEVKAPGRSVDPKTFSGHDLTQWRRQRDLPNLIYTNGREWRMWRDLDQVGDPVILNQIFEGVVNSPDVTKLETLLTDFLRWKPAPINTVHTLVRSIAPLTRLLRGEVLDQLAVEEVNRDRKGDKVTTPFSDLARDWRQLLFPSASDEAFADGYAQAVTFALLLARSENIDLENLALHEVGRTLGGSHSLMGKALQVLTDDIKSDFQISLELLVRVIAAVNWQRVRRNPDTYLHLYENFLEVYDPDLRKQSGTYYTPRPIVTEMVRFAEDVLATRLHKSKRFIDESVVTVDPAMGTGTYLHAIIERAAEQVEVEDGPGAVSGAMNVLARRLIGFELQMGSFAVAELRTTDLLRSLGAKLPDDGLRLFVTDTLDDPHATVTNIGAGLELIARSRRKANQIKAGQQVTVVIGNPPYRERAEGLGGWIEGGDSANNLPAPLNDFRDPRTGRYEHNLKNLYVYFWRWATRKVFDDFPAAGGIVCFISTSGYLKGPGFAGMRRYLRERASEGWIINVSPEGMRPPINTRIFPGVQQPIAIGIFVRKPDTSNSEPAHIRYVEVTGRRNEKYEKIATLGLDDPEWRSARREWTAPFTPAADSDWDSFVALNDLFPWTSPGATANRRWPISTTPGTLKIRWNALLGAATTELKAALFKVTRDRDIVRSPRPLPAPDASTSTTPLMYEYGGCVEPVRYGYRALDRQWVIPDARLWDNARPDLWRARIPGQVFALEQHARALDNGPATVFSALLPDLDHFLTRHGGGGRVLPLLHPDGLATVPAKLLEILRASLGVDVSGADLMAYVAGVTSHSGFTQLFHDELRTPGVRVPLTTDMELWRAAIHLGSESIWAQTYGEAYSDETQGRIQGSVRYGTGDPRRVLALTPVEALSDSLEYDEASQTIHIGTGIWGPVTFEMWNYQIGMRPVITSWFNYRRPETTGRVTSQLDRVVAGGWSPEWTNEFTDLLSTIRRLTELELKQADLLNKIMSSAYLTVSDLEAAGYNGPSQDEKKPRTILGDGDIPALYA